jgi:ergot alkaloid biosynthesis protein
MAYLHDQGTLASAASRQAGPGRVRFDWTDRATWGDAIDGTRSVYLVAPMGAGDPAPVMIDFVQAAIARGARRFVLLSASLLEAGGPAMGQVHQWLAQSGVEWAVLRPSWFMENLSEGPHCATIRDERALYSAAGEGSVPFISADDIARAAAAALTADHPPNRDFVLTGPEPLSYDQVAEHISMALGTTVTHARLNFDELVARHVALGLSEPHAQTLAFMDLAIEGGAEDRVTHDLEKLAPGRPVTFAEFVTQNMTLWRTP